jgi:hypothetical protein
VENWRIQYDSTGNYIFLTGELGSIKKYEIESTEITDTLRTPEIFSTSMAYVFFLK